MESQLQNPEFRNYPAYFHPWAQKDAQYFLTGPSTQYLAPKNHGYPTNKTHLHVFCDELLTSLGQRRTFRRFHIYRDVLPCEPADVSLM